MNSLEYVILSHCIQPSARVFSLFDHIYVISYNGCCIYEGSPQAMLDHLNSVDLHCPQFHNPADYIAEVASGEHGTEAVDRLIEVKQHQDAELDVQKGSSRSLAQYSSMQSYPWMLHIWILFQRTTLHILRDPMLNTLRFLSHLLTALFIGKFKVSKEDTHLDKSLLQAFCMDKLLANHPFVLHWNPH